MRFLRNVLILLGSALFTIYLGALAFLYGWQRELLFPRGTATLEAPPVGSVYHPLKIVEPDRTRLTIWQAPAGSRAKGTFVLFCGNGSSLLEFAAVGEQIHRAGYRVVLASYRGYPGNSGTPSEEGLLADARSILATISHQERPIILWGHSLGSGVAARMASEGLGSALVLESPFTAAVDVAAAAYPLFPVRALMKDRFDTFSLVHKIKMPVLILHGTGDEVVPMTMGKQLAHAFGVRATFVPIAGAGHNMDATALWPLVSRWLQSRSDVIQSSNSSRDRRRVVHEHSGT